jgi:HD-like signal output (HDOD) protein
MTGLVRQPPVAAQRALALTRDTDTSVSKLVALVERDPTLGQALLRYANSAYYATDGGPCTSFAAAIQRVGMGGVHNVVLGALLNVLMCRPGGAYQVLAEKSWSHMVRTAPIARAFAPAFDVNTDEAYAIGLLHDAGKLVIFDRLGSLRTHLRRDLAIPYTSLAALLRMLHEDLGALAALQWGLGANIARAIAAHHRAPVPQVQDSLSEVLYLAERCDISVQHRRPIDLESLWRDGELTGSRLMVEEILASPSGDVIMPAVISEDSSMKMPTSSTGGLPSGPRS